MPFDKVQKRMHDAKSKYKMLGDKWVINTL